MPSDKKSISRQEHAVSLNAITGCVQAFSRSTLPENWAWCDGSKLLITDQPSLYAVIGARFGGDGITNFALPDLPPASSFAICLDGYFPMPGTSVPDLRLSGEDADYLAQRVRSFQSSYAQGIDPFGAHQHISELDQEWLNRQVQMLKDGIAQGKDLMHRHVHVSELDPEWLERQAQVLKDAYAQGRDPLHRHTHVDELDSSWLERQGQVLVDAHARHSHPLDPHTHADDLDPDWLLGQGQVLKDAYAQEHNPHHRHPNLEDLDPEWLETQVKSMIDLDAPGSAESKAARSKAYLLQKIEGIGPKTAAALANAGIENFSELAAASKDELRAILKQARLRLSDPGTWPEQASLAADGLWKELERLQKALKGGRRPK